MKYELVDERYNADWCGIFVSLSVFSEGDHNL